MQALAQPELLDKSTVAYAYVLIKKERDTPIHPADLIIRVVKVTPNDRYLLSLLSMRVYTRRVVSTWRALNITAHINFDTNLSMFQTRIIEQKFAIIIL